MYLLLIVYSACSCNYKEFKKYYFPGNMKVKVKSSLARILPMEIYYRRMWGQLSITCSNASEWHNEVLPVEVNHGQQRTMPYGRSNWLAVTPHPT